ncbi:MAG: DUF5685 family protein [Christensenellaceae bacterium]|jgi:hypothetical protein
MFGYITPYVGELKVREYELYQTYYCGLCSVLKKKYNKTSILNYDCTFIYLLGDALKNEQAGEAAPYACRLHPIRKRNALVTEAAGYAADINALMGHAKIEDDARDGRFRAKLLLPFYKRLYKKARESQPLIYGKMLEMSEGLTRLEQEKSADTDATAHTYAQLFGGVLMELDLMQSHILYDFGYSLGRWVYLVDAYDDIKRDIRQGDYNVFVEKYKLSGDGEVPEEVKKAAEFSLFYALGNAAQEFSRLEIKKNKSILENIVYYGLKDRTNKVLEGKMDEPIRSLGR